MTKTLAAFAACLTLALALLAAPTSTPTAEAASTCGASGTIGAPLLKNIGPRSQNTVKGTETGPINYINYGSPEYYCPAWIYVHSGYDIEILCSNGVYYWRRAYGWNSFGTHCNQGKNSSVIEIREYRQ